MARAAYIYIVDNGGITLAAFTVKHECISWLAQARMENHDVSLWHVTRVRDGQTAKLSEHPCPADQFYHAN
jgi:hypothetical protein